MKLAVQQNKSKGVLLTIVAASSFGLIPFFAKLAYSGGFNPLSFSLFRSLFTAVILLGILKAKNISLIIQKQQLPTLIKASFFGYFLMMVTLFTSYDHLATGIATTLHFTYPMATMIGAIIFYREKASMLQIGAIALSLPGIYLLVGASSTGGISLYGALLALASGLFYAYYILAVSHGNIQRMNSLLVIFYIAVFNTLTLLPATAFTGHLSLELTIEAGLAVLMVVMISSVLGMVAFQEGLKNISATAAAILSTSEVITSLIVGVSILGENLSIYQSLGCLMILAAVIVVALPERRH